MSARTLAIALSLNRLAFGVGFLASPASSARSWIGARAAARPQTQVFTRALGARELALSLGALSAIRGEEHRAASAWMAGHALADATDLAATLATRRSLPSAGVAFATVMAGASTAVAAWSSYRLAAE